MRERYTALDVGLVICSTSGVTSCNEVE